MINSPSDSIISVINIKLKPFALTNSKAQNDKKTKKFDFQD